MNSDSDNTRIQKRRIQATLLEDYGINTPNWLREGATLADLRLILKHCRDARERYDLQEQEANRTLARSIVRQGNDRTLAGWADVIERSGRQARGED